MSAKRKAPQNWASRLVGQVVDTGAFEALKPEHLDRLLAWLAGREGPAADLISGEFSTRSVDETEAKRLALSALDDYLFAEDIADPLLILGLEPEADRQAIKIRYRRLMQVYHPDRAVVHGDWLTNRAETINQAYSQLNRNGRVSPNENGTAASAAARPDFQAKAEKPDYPPAQDKFHLRKSLGSAQKFQREVLITLAVVSLLMLGLIYLSSRDQYVPSGSGQTRDVDGENEWGESERDKKQAASILPPEKIAFPTPTEFAVSDNKAPPMANTQHTPPAPAGIAMSQEGELPPLDIVESVKPSQSPEDREAGGLEPQSTPPESEPRQVSSFGKESQSEDVSSPEANVTDSVEAKPILADTKSPATMNRNATDPGGESDSNAEPEAITFHESTGANQPDTITLATVPENSTIQKQRETPPQTEAPAPKPAKEAVAAVLATELSSTPQRTKKQPSIESASSQNTGQSTEKNGQETNRPKPNPVKEIPATPMQPVIRTVEINPTTVAPPTPREPTKVERFIAKRVLSRYVDAIVDGDLNKLSSTIGQEVTVNGAPESKRDFLAHYKQVFQDTSKRSYKVKIQSWMHTENNTILIQCIAEIRFSYVSSPTKSYKGILTYNLVKKGMDAKLVGIVQK